MISDVAVGAYHHYCSQLCNGLVAQPDIDTIRLVSIFGEREHVGVAPEEQKLLHPRVSIEVLGPGTGSKFGRYVLFLHNALGYIKRVIKDPPDVVHIQTPTGNLVLDVGLLLLYRCLRIPIIRTIHEVTAAERSGRPTFVERWIGHGQLRLAHALIVHDAATRQRLHDISAPAIPVSVIPHGNYLFFRTYRQPTKAAAKPRTIPVALFLGIKRHKGLEVFAKALRQLQNADYPIRAIIAGKVNPGDEDLIESFNNLRIAEVQTGYVPNSQLWRLFELSDMVVLPYLQGTTSGSIHLAYAFKRPVIVSDLPCFQELVTPGKTGLVVPRGDPDALKTALMMLSADPDLRARMGEEGFRVESSPPFDWQHIAAQTAQLYREVATRRRF